jgi:hypothetical protein
MGMLNMLKKLFAGTATVALTAGVLTGAAQAQISGNVVILLCHKILLI